MKIKDIVNEVRDPEDWDEGNTEPANNFAVYINGKKWKVFKGRGYYADDFREREHFRQLQDWANKKSYSTGKKWTVHITGEPPTMSESATAGATSSGNIASVVSPHAAIGKDRTNKSFTGSPGKSGTKAPRVPAPKQPKNADGTAKNALDMKANVFGSTIKR